MNNQAILEIIQLANNPTTVGKAGIKLCKKSKITPENRANHERKIAQPETDHRLFEPYRHQIMNPAHKYKSKMRNKMNRAIKSLLTTAVTVLMVSSGGVLFAQHYEWELDKAKKREQEKKRELDSLMVHYKNNWHVSLSYGRFYFNNSARSGEESILEFPKNIGVWNLSAGRYLSEHLSVNVNAGLLIKKIVPPNPDVISILSGAEVEIEGGGIILMPVSVGMDYFFMKKRFRPYAGFSFGVIPARYKYIEASGDLSNGINRNEYKFDSNAPFVELSSGFLYRTGKNAQFGLNCDYVQSKDFTENIGGYNAYNGFKISAVFSVIF